MGDPNESGTFSEQFKRTYYKHDDSVRLLSGNGREYMQVDDPVTLASFVAFCSSSCRPVFLRGETNHFTRSVPSLFRDDGNGNERKQRWNAYQLFLNELRPRLTGDRWEKTKELGAVLQHYGIRTPWLDVVRNLYTAIWFATHDFETRGCCLVVNPSEKEHGYISLGAALLRRGVFALFMGLFARGCVSPVLISGGQQPSQRVPASFRRPAEPRNGAEHRRSVPPSGALPSGHSRGVLVRCRGKGGRPAMAVTTGFQGRTFDVPQTGVPCCIDLPSPAPCAAADAVFADAKAFLSSSEARQMSESELERELHRRRQELVRKLLQGHRDQRSPKEAAGPAEDTGGVECSEPHEHESHAETTSGTMQVVGLGCARRGHDGLHRLDAALNLLPERYLVEMRRRVTIATASRAPPRTPWKPQWYSTSSTWQRRRGVRCSSSAHRRACRHLVRDPMGVDRRTVTLGCSCGGSQPPQLQPEP